LRVNTHDPYAALRHRDYRLVLIGRVFANIGSNMQTVAVGWELYERTHSAMALGWVGLVQVLPVMLFALPAGHLADRLDRRRLVMAAHLLMVAAAVGLAILSHEQGPVAWIYACLFAVGVGRAVAMPAGSSLMPLLVPKAAFSNAVTWSSSGFQLASTIGPALGGFLIASFGQAAAVYWFNAGLTLLYVGCLLAMRLRAQERPAEPMTLHHLLAGVRFVWNEKVILPAITLDMFAVLLGGATALLPIYAKDILHVGPAGLGWLRAMPAIGAIVMGFAIAHRPPLKHAGPAMLWAVAGFGVATVVFGLSKIFWLSLAMLFVAGALDAISVVVRHTLVQMRTPDALRGRVSAVNSLFISSSNELGDFEAGTVAAWFGPVVSVVSGGVGTVLVVAWVAKRWPAMRRLRALNEATL